MDLDNNCCFLENNFDQLVNLLSPVNSDISFNNISDESNQLSDIIDGLGFDLNSQSNDELLGMDDSSIFDAVTLSNNFINQIFYDNASPSTSDSGNYSPTCSTSDDQNASDTDRKINIAKATQIHQFETKSTAVPNPSRLVPVQIPLRQIVANSKSASNHPVICIMPAKNYAKSINSEPLVKQNEQRMLSPKREGSASVQTFTSTPTKNTFTHVNNLSTTSSSGVAHHLRPQRNTKMDIHFSDYDRRKEDRKIRNRYSAQLSRIRKKNEIDEMKRNLTNKDVIIEKLKNEIVILKETIETLRKENEMLKSSATKRNRSGRLGLVAGVTSLFAFISLLNLDPVGDATSLVALNLEKSNMYSVEHGANIGRTLLSLDYDGDIEYTSRRNSLANKKSDALSESNLNYSVNCGNVQKKYLNQTEAMKLNNDVFAWINRHECLKFMHIRRIFRFPIHKEWPAPNVTIKSDQDAARKRMDKKNHQQRTAIDKMEAARLKAVRDRAWRHIDMISSNADNKVIKSQVKTMDYDVMSSEHLLTNWLQGKTDTLTTLDMESQYAELARNLKQYEDTLYIVAMKNYYLLPATDRNSTMQPRMALILPALSFNGTMPNQVAMMRLECDITGTGLFHLPSTLLPLFYDHSTPQ